MGGYKDERKKAPAAPTPKEALEQTKKDHARAIEVFNETAAKHKKKIESLEAGIADLEDRIKQLTAEKEEILRVTNEEVGAERMAWKAEKEAQEAQIKADREKVAGELAAAKAAQDEARIAQDRAKEAEVKYTQANEQLEPREKAARQQLDDARQTLSQAEKKIVEAQREQSHAEDLMGNVNEKEKRIQGILDSNKQVLQDIRTERGILAAEKAEHDRSKEAAEKRIKDAAIAESERDQLKQAIATWQQKNKQLDEHKEVLQEEDRKIRVREAAVTNREKAASEREKTLKTAEVKIVGAGTPGVIGG